MESTASLNLKGAIHIDLCLGNLWICLWAFCASFHKLAGRVRHFIKKTFVQMLEEKKTLHRLPTPFPASTGLLPTGIIYCFTGLSDGAVSISFAWLLCNLVAFSWEKSHLNIHTELLSHFISSHIDLTLSHGQSLASVHRDSKCVWVRQARYLGKGLSLSTF